MLAITTKSPVVGNPADASNSRRTRAAFVAAHGRLPNAPLSDAECDDLASGMPAMHRKAGALATRRMFGEQGK